MSATTAFRKFAGKQIQIMQDMGPLFLYVLAPGELEGDGLSEMVGDIHPQGALEEGWTVVAIEGEIEEGEARAGGFLAVHEATDRSYLCDSGTIRFLDGAASELPIELNDD